MRLDRRGIDALGKHQRIALINSLSGYKAATLVGTVSEKRQTNLALFNSLVHIGANPPLLGLVFRPDTVERHTLSNIRQQRVYTVNHVLESFLEAAHQTSAPYPRDVSEFAATGLSELWDPDVDAPFVREAKVRVALRYVEEVQIRSNGTSLLIGEVFRVDAPDEAMLACGAVNAAAAGNLAVTGLNTYYRAQFIARLDRADSPT